MSLLIGLKGGLGNQLFQFAHGINCAIRSNQPISFYWDQAKSESNTPREFELNFLNIELEKYYEIIRKENLDLKLVPVGSKQKWLSLKKMHRQKEFFFTKELQIKKKRINTVSGYWQGEVFFREHHGNISSYIDLSLTASNNFKISNNGIAGVHLRFGDYFYSSKIKEVHGVISRDYLARATEVMSGKGINTFHIYTDSVEIASDYLKNLNPRFQIEFMTLGTPLADMAGLRSYDSLIGSNSSFSWWASYLGNKKKTVILPRNWFNRSSLLLNPTVDLFKPEWITIGL
jgi:hypothetical protein